MEATTGDRIRRTFEQRHEHYLVERGLADRLRNASKLERRELYATVYDELFQRVPHHPQLLQKQDSRQRVREVEQQIALLQPLLGPKTTFLEIGAGDCMLSVAVAGHVTQVYAIDVSAEIAKSDLFPTNLALILSDGTSIHVPPGSVDLAYSNQLMEHLHPDDALEQVQNIVAALAPGGRYLCITPNRLSGPHDVSRFFDREATCFHLKEYTTSELADLFRQAGFRHVQVVVTVGKRLLLLPVLPLRLVEAGLALLPYQVRRGLGRRLPLRKFLGKVIAFK